LSITDVLLGISTSQGTGGLLRVNTENKIEVTSAAQSTSTLSGALRTSGGLAVAKAYSVQEHYHGIL
jgi:hypothetical protein